MRGLLFVLASLAAPLASRADPPKPPPLGKDKAGQGVVESLAPGTLWKQQPGKQVGILLSAGSPWGNTIDWHRSLPIAGPRGPARYEFFSEGGIWPLYFASTAGANLMKGWSMPVPGGRSPKYDATMFDPSTPNSWGLKEPVHLVELEINGGAGAATTSVSMHFVATGVRVLEGTKGYLPSASAVFDDARARWDAFLADRASKLERERRAAERATPGAAFGPEIAQHTEGLFPTWSQTTRTLRIVFYRRDQRWSTKTDGDRSDGEHTRTTRTYQAELGLVLTYDAAGKLIAQRTLEPVGIPGPKPVPQQHYTR